MKKMANPNYSKKEISWALSELGKKGVKDPTREHAIKLLDTFKEFGKVVVDEIKKDKKPEAN